MRVYESAEKLSLSFEPVKGEETADAYGASEIAETKFLADKLRFGRPIEAAQGLHKLLGLESEEELSRLRNAEGLVQKAHADALFEALRVVEDMQARECREIRRDSASLSSHTLASHRRPDPAPHRNSTPSSSS